MKRVRLSKPCYKCGGSHYMKAGGSFEPHMMYDPKTGKGVNAETYEDHLALKDQGFLHEEEMQMKSGGNWIQDVTKSMKARGTEGRCTGSKFGGPDCPKGSPQYNLAVTFRKMANKREKKQYGGDIAEQNRSVNSITGDRKNMFMDHVSRNAQNAIMEDALIEQQNMMTKQMYNNGGNTWMRQGAANEINLANQMYADNQAALSGIGKSFSDALGGYDFARDTEMYFDVKGKDEIGKEKRKEARDWYKDYSKQFKKQAKAYNMYGPDAYNFMGPLNTPQSEQDEKRYGGMPKFDPGGNTGEKETDYTIPTYDPSTDSSYVDPSSFYFQPPGIFNPLSGYSANSIVNNAYTGENNNGFVEGPIQHFNPADYSEKELAEYRQYLFDNAFAVDGEEAKEALPIGEYYNQKGATQSGTDKTTDKATTEKGVKSAVSGSQAAKSGKTASKDVYEQGKVEGKQQEVKGDIDPSTLRKPNGTATTDTEGTDTKTTIGSQQYPAGYNAWMAGRRGLGRGTGAPVWMPLPSGALMEGWDYSRERRGPLGLGGRRETWSYKGIPNKEGTGIPLPDSTIPDSPIDIAPKPSPGLIDYDNDGTPDLFPKRLPEGAQEDYTKAQAEYEDLLRAQEMDKDNEELKVAMAKEQEASRVATDPLMEGMTPVNIKPGPGNFMYEQPAPSFTASTNTQPTAARDPLMNPASKEAMQAELQARREAAGMGRVQEEEEVPNMFASTAGPRAGVSRNDFFGASPQEIAAQQGRTAAPQKSLAQLKAESEAQMRAEGMDVDPAMMYNVGPQNSFVAPKGSQEWSEQQASAQDDDMPYQYGGVVELSQDEIDQILAMGGKVEYLD